MNEEGRRIVVGFDGSEPALRALRAAIDQASPSGTLIVVYVYWIPPEVRYYEFFEDVEQKLAEVAQAVLDPAREELKSAGTQAQFEALPGKPADVLRSLARERRADLLVVGARGLGGVRAALGSVAFRVLHGAPCPVLVVPGEQPE